MEVDGLNGQNLDMRLKHVMLTDTILQTDLTGDEYRAFSNLMCWVVSLLSDGVFDSQKAQVVVPHVSAATINRFVSLGLVLMPDGNECQIAPSYWKWQSTQEELQRVRDRKRQRAVRAVSAEARELMNNADVPHGCRTQLGAEVTQALQNHDQLTVKKALWDWSDDGLPVSEFAAVLAKRAE